jgi:hypothetical protein
MRRYKFISNVAIPRAEYYPLKVGEHVKYSHLYLDEVNRQPQHLGEVGYVKSVNPEMVFVVWPQGPRNTSNLQHKYLDRIIP